MNPLELRYEIYKFLIGIGQPAALISAALESPEPGESCAIGVVTEDMPPQPGITRRYHITIEEITD